MEDLGKNLGELEKVIGGKSDNVRIVEDGELAISQPKGLIISKGLADSVYCSVAAKSDAGRIRHWPRVAMYCGCRR